MGGTCSHRSGEEINQIKKAARKSTGQPHIHLSFFLNIPAHARPVLYLPR